jgi:hypothetical protein
LPIAEDAAAAEVISAFEISMINLCVFSGTKNLGCPFASSFEAASGLEATTMGGFVIPPDRDPFAF